MLIKCILSIRLRINQFIESIRQILGKCWLLNAFKVNSKDARTTQLTIKTSHWSSSGIFIINFEHIQLNLFKFEKFFFRATNSTLLINWFHFKLLTEGQTFCFYFRVTNSKFKNKKIHFVLVNRWLNFYLPILKC